MIVRTDREREALSEGGKILAEVLQELAQMVRPGLTTHELNEKAAALIKERDAEPSFLGYRGYPAVLCTSVNETVVHGIPSRDVLLRDGDIIGLDLGLRYKGFFTDMAVTVPVGKVSAKALHLIAVTKSSLEKGIAMLKPGVTLGDLGSCIQTYVEKEGCSVIRDLVGHGVGRKIHEEPMIPNFGVPGRGVEFQKGHVIAVEPMVAAGDWHVKTLSDGWSVLTMDGSLAAHFEHTLLLTETGVDVLTKS